MSTDLRTPTVNNPTCFQELVVWQEWDLGKEYKIKLVERFEEPLYRNLVREFFYESMQGWNWEKLLNESEKEQCQVLKKSFAFPKTIRLAAYHKDKFIGWSVGWQDGEHSFYMANSAVLPEYRR